MISDFNHYTDYAKFDGLLYTKTQVALYVQHLVRKFGVGTYLECYLPPRMQIVYMHESDSFDIYYYDIAVVRFYNDHSSKWL